VLILLDTTDLQNSKSFLENHLNDTILSKDCAVVINKIDIASSADCDALVEIALKLGIPALLVSAKKQINLDVLVDFLMNSIHKGNISANDVVITNTRHFEALSKANEAISRVIEGLKRNISGDFLAQDIRECLHYLGEITGEISTDEVLGNVFKNFCIGK